MKEIQTELQVFLSLYHKKKDLVEALDLVLLEKKKMEHDLDGNIKSKEETLSKKKNRGNRRQFCPARRRQQVQEG